MLEIFGIMSLCGANRKNAAARGAKPGKYIAFTILLWVGFEFLGALIGQLAELGLGTYVLALVFAAIGGFISYKLAKGNGEQVASVLPAPNQPPQTQGVPRTLLVAAARAVFNNPYSALSSDPEDKLWKETVQKELELLIKGGVDSVSVIEELLMHCANGYGGSISDSWWYGSVWAVKAAAMLPKREAAGMMVCLLQRNSNIAEWFTYVQCEAARQLCVIGESTELPALQRILEKPLSMSPVSEIAKAAEKIGGKVPQTPAAILHKAQDQLGDEEGIEFLLPLMEQVQTWEKDNIGFYYYLLAHKAERLGFSEASRAFYAAQVATRPDSTSMGWQLFIKEGIAPSPDAAEKLHKRYPVPKTMAEIRGTSSAAAVPVPQMREPSEPKSAPALTPDKKKITIVVIAFVAVAVIAVLGVSVYFLTRGPAVNTAKLLDKGLEYLDNGEYDKALEQFRTIIDANEEVTDAYLGAADAYIALEQTDRAARILEKGYRLTGSSRISRKLNELNGGEALATESADKPMPESANKPAPESEPAPNYETNPAAAADPNERGNSNGNAANGSLAAIKGEWIFYISAGTIYKTSISGTGKTLLADGDCSCLNVVGDWIYYVEDNRIKAMTTDGAERTQISDDFAVSINVIGDWIYYTNYASYNENMDWNEPGIHKMKTDGSEKEWIGYDLCYDASVVGDWVYYLNDEYFMYKIRTDGSDRTQLTDLPCGSVNVVGDWIYFADSSDNNIYKMKLDGSEKTQINSDYSGFVNVSGDWIYYSNFSFADETIGGDIGLYRIRLDGSDKEQLTNDKAFIPNVAGDWLYYLSLGDEYVTNFCKVRTDGTQQEILNK